MGAYESSLGPAEPPDCDYSGEDDDCEIYDGRSEDCNQNTIPDQCDSFGDFDSDGEVDLKDFARFQRCFTGEDQSGLDDTCCFFDVEPDLDVDLDDYAEFESAFSE